MTNLLTIKEVASRLKMNKFTIYRKVESGELPSVRLGSRAVRVDEKDLNAWIQKRKRK